MSSSNPYGPEEREFLREYECKLDKEFELDGVAASWAPSEDGPRFWDEEDESIDVPTGDPSHGLGPTTALALTPDDKYLAVAVNTVIRLYDMETLQMCAQVSGYVCNIDFIGFRPQVPTYLPVKDEGYLLISQTISQTIAFEEIESKIYKTVFDQAGLEINDNISPSLLAKGALPKSGSQIWNSLADRMIYLPNNSPDVIVLEMPSGREVCRLQGHFKETMWASWSNDSTVIATANRDGTFGLWNAQTGVRMHKIVTYGGNRSGAFLGDGAHVLLLSSSWPHRAGIYSIETAELIVSLQAPDGVELDRWMRLFTVHPSREKVILRNEWSLLAWSPFEPTSNGKTAAQVILTIQSSDDESGALHRFGEICNLKWVDRGRKLLAQSSDYSIFVWEPEKRLKWRFQRPKGRAVFDRSLPDVLYARRKGTGWVLSLDENKVRFWKL